METREYLHVELRNEGTEEEPMLRGMAIPYNQPSEPLPYIELIQPGAFRESLSGGRDVVALLNHDTGKLLARQSNGTLDFEDTPEGLSVTIKPNTGTSYGKDALALVQRGDLKNMSFGFTVDKDEWSDKDGKQHRTIQKAQLYEISLVGNPAYKQTTISKRDNEEDQSMENKEMNVQTEERNVPQVAINEPENKQEEVRDFNHFLRTGEVRAQTVSSATKGAALAPVDFANEIIKGLADMSAMRQIARILPPISGKSATYPRHLTGPTAAFVAEGVAIDPADHTFDQVELIPKKLAALVEVSNELLQDEAVDLQGFLTGYMSEDFAEVAENAYWNGDGTGANPLGILMAESAPGTPMIERVDAAASIAITADDILKLYNALPAKYRRTAVWVMSPAVESVVRTLKDGNGNYLLISDFSQGMKQTMLGRPVVLSDAFPDTLEADADIMAFGDFKRSIYIGDKAGVDIQRNDSIGFNKDVTAFRGIFRTDIVVALPEAVKVLKMVDGL